MVLAGNGETGLVDRQLTIAFHYVWNCHGLFLILMTTSSEKGRLIPQAYFRTSGLFIDQLCRRCSHDLGWLGLK
jgi:hypothetical protein